MPENWRENVLKHKLLLCWYLNEMSLKKTHVCGILCILVAECFHFFIVRVAKHWLQYIIQNRKKILQPFPYNFYNSSVCTHDLKENQICVCKESAHNFEQIICYSFDTSYLIGLYTLYSRNVNACTNMMIAFCVGSQYIDTLFLTLEKNFPQWWKKAGFISKHFQQLTLFSCIV